MCGDRTKEQWPKAWTWKVPYKDVEDILYGKNDGALEQAAQSYGGVSFYGGIQDAAGYLPVPLIVD